MTMSEQGVDGYDGMAYNSNIPTEDNQHKISKQQTSLKPLKDG